MNYVIEISGGIGKHVMATAFIRWLNEKHPKNKITVVSAYPDIFEYNPRVHRNLRLDQPYLFEDYIKGNDYRKGNPYELEEFYREKNKKHLMQLFPKAYRFNQICENPESEIYLTRGEEMDGKIYCEQHKPLITFQAVGGLPPGMMPGRNKVDSSQRDIPPQIAAYIVQLLRQNGFNVLQLRNMVEPQILGTLQIDLPFRNIMPVVKHAAAHVGIDSLWMHVAGCFKKPMLTFWGGTHKDNFGYNHKGSFHAFTKNAMHGRPYFAVHDRCALYPYKDKREGFEFDFSMRDIEKHITQFIDFLKNKEGGKNVENNKGNPKKDVL